MIAKYADELNISNEELLKKLHLMENGKLKRAAVLLFYHDPSVVQPGICIRIGKFGEQAEVEYQDVLEGSLLTMADRVIDLIYLKYLKAKISYEHDRRIETYPFDRNAIREAVYNAIVHNCYMFGVPIQIRIEEESIIISNHCILPDGWTVETLMQPHESEPYNPRIANVFYLAGSIETWGQGIKKICDSCRAIGAEVPTFELRGNGMRVHFAALQSALIKDSKVPKAQSAKNSDTLDDTLADQIIDIIKSNPTITIDQMTEQVGISRRTMTRCIEILKNTRQIERVGGKRYGHWEVLQ